MGESLRSYCFGRRQKRNMIIGISISLLIVLVCLLLFSTAEKNHETLQLVHMIFRHGDRTPTETYFNDPYKNYNWPGGWGSLTNKGKQQLFLMGQTLRGRYKLFMDEHFTVNDVTVKTSDADRCFMSAGTFLAGLLPPSADETWNKDLFWQPVPIRSVPRAQDNLIAMKQKCNKYDLNLKEAYNSEKILQINKENAEMYEFITKNAGQLVDDITDVEFLFNTLEIEDQNGLKLPSWTQKYYPEKMKILAARSLSIFTETEAMRRLKGGVILKEIIEHITDKQNNKQTKKMFLYSGHDISLTNIIRTLGFVEDMKPEYGATLVFETHSTNYNDYEIKILYFNNTWTEKPHVLKLNGCGDICLFNDFIKALDNVIPVDWKAECDG